MQELKAGDTLDHYLIDRVVARSGMATLFHAVDQRNGKEVAIKVPHPEVESDPALFDRFEREKQIGIAMEHPGVVKVFEDRDHSRVYMVMEWVDGRLLREVLRAPIAQERAIAITLAILDALEYLHMHGVVHRDLKPENIMVAESPGVGESPGEPDRIKLIDFGIAGNAGSRRLTFANFSTQLGTPDYIAPEQVKGKRGDARTDLYSLGVMLYEMLTHTLPFRGSNPFAVMNDRLRNEPLAPRAGNPELSPQIEEILLRALERDPRNRYQSAREFAHDLRHPEEIVITARAARSSARKVPSRRTVLIYAGLAAIPLLLFALLVYTAHVAH